VRRLRKMQLAKSTADVFWGHTHEDQVSVGTSDLRVDAIAESLEIDILLQQWHGNEHRNCSDVILGMSQSTYFS
jgi:hypothetical protein